MILNYVSSKDTTENQKFFKVFSRLTTSIYFKTKTGGFLPEFLVYLHISFYAVEPKFLVILHISFYSVEPEFLVYLHMVTPTVTATAAARMKQNRKTTQIINTI